MRVGLLTLSAVVMVGCGADSLRGSYEQPDDEIDSLGFTRVLLRKQLGFVVVEYDRLDRAAEIVCKVAFDVADLERGRTYGSDFMGQVTLSRMMLDGTVFPKVSSGSFGFEQLRFEHQGPVAGHFDFLFEDGRTLGGDFAGRLVEVVIE